MFKQGLVALGFSMISSLAAAQAVEEYRVTITNITPGQTFTPQLVVTHPGNYLLFNLGQPASEALEVLAEGGDTSPVMEQVGSEAMDVQTIPDLLGPGQSVTTTVSGVPTEGFITIAAMLIPTNDTFFALNRMQLPASGAELRLVPAYDAGTELNDQSCASIPGPRCGGEGYSPGGGEGYVHIGNGFHDMGDVADDGSEVLGPRVYDWRNSVARVVVRRLEQ